MTGPAHKAPPIAAAAAAGAAPAAAASCGAEPACLPVGLVLPESRLTSPVLRTGLDYWQRIRGEREIPARRDLDPADIATILPNVMLKDVCRDPLDFRYRLVGSRARHHSQADYTGKRMSELAHQGPSSVVFRVCAWVVENRRPLLLRPPYAGPQRDFLWIEAAVMPLSDGRDDARAAVDKLFIVLDFLRKGAPGT